MTFWLIIDISCLLPCRMVVGSRLKLSYQEPSYIVNALWHVIPAMNAFCWIFNDISQLFCHVLWWNLECFQDDMEGLFLLEECLNLVNNLSFLWKGIKKNGIVNWYSTLCPFLIQNTDSKNYSYSPFWHYIILFTYPLHVKSSFISLRSRKLEKKGLCIGFHLKFLTPTTGSWCFGGVIYPFSVFQTVSPKLSCSNSSLFIRMTSHLQLPALKCIPGCTNVATKAKRQHDKILLLWIMEQMTQKSLKCALY